MKTQLITLYLLAMAWSSYSQQLQVRQKGYVLYEDSTRLEGWIAGLADSTHHPVMIELYPDSLSNTPRTIWAYSCFKIVLNSGRRYMSAFYCEPVMVAGYMADLRQTRQFQFVPLLVEGKYNLIRAVHHDHIDVAMITLSGSRLTNWPLQFHRIDKGVAQIYWGKGKEYLGQIWLEEHFSTGWAEQLGRQLADSTVSISDWVAGLNSAIDEHVQAQRRLHTQGVDRLRVSLSAGQTFAYNRLVFPLIADDGLKGPVHGTQLGADIVLRSGDSTEIRFLGEIGYKQHHFNGFYFNSLRLNAGVLMQCYWNKRTDWFAGLVFGHYVYDWSAALSRQFDELASMWHSRPTSHHTACTIRTGIFTKPGNWQIALSYSAISTIENDKIYFSMYHFGLHLSKHIDFYLDTFKRRRK